MSCVRRRRLRIVQNQRLCTLVTADRAASSKPNSKICALSARAEPATLHTGRKDRERSSTRDARVAHRWLGTCSHATTRLPYWGARALSDASAAARAVSRIVSFPDADDLCGQPPQRRFARKTAAPTAHSATTTEIFFGFGGVPPFAVTSVHSR